MLKNINARNRIVLVVLASVLPVLGMTLYSGLQQRSAAGASERQQLRLIAELAAKRPAQVIEGARQLLFAISGDADRLLANRKDCHAHFQPLVVASAGVYHSMGLIHPDGELFCSSADPAAGGRIDLGDRLHFRLAASSGKFAVGEYQIGRVTGLQSINFGHPVLDAGNRLRAVLFVSLDLATFTEQGELQEATPQQGPGRVMTIIDRNGTVLAQYPKFQARVGEKVPNPAVLQQVLGMKRGMFTATDLGGVRRIYAVESVGANPDGVAPLRVIVSSPEPMIYAESNQALLRTIAGTVLVTILMAVVAWFGAEALVLRPFRVLLGVAEKVRLGDLGARTGFSEGHEELGRLGVALDGMVQELQNRDLQLKQLLRQLNEQAVTDQLTGLPNRRYLWDVLEAELMRARRKQSPLAVMMLDIDHFKDFNDRHGHEAGDLVLKNVAHALRQVVRGSDIVARHGGEEFVIVLPEATEDVARARAEALREEIAALRLTYGGKALETITLSVGIAVSADAHESAEELVRAADDAMYEAKRSGRNRVVFKKAQQA